MLGTKSRWSTKDVREFYGSELKAINYTVSHSHPATSSEMVFAPNETRSTKTNERMEARDGD